MAFLIGSATAGPYFQGFEEDTGDWFFYDNGAVSDRVNSGSGMLRVTSASGLYHLELGNLHDAYATGFGSAGISYFGQSDPDPAYQGSFYQAVDVYIDPTWDGLGFWIDMSPSNVDGTSFYAAQGNFRLTASGSSVKIQAINSTILTTITTAGWYTFEICWSKGKNPTDLINIDLNVYDSTVTLLGSESFLAVFPSGMGGYPGESQYLGNSSYVWFTVWENNFAGDVIAIDNVRTGIKYPIFQAAPNIAAGDLNGDNLDDLAEVTASNQVRYSIDLRSWLNIPGELVSIVTGDLNGDGNDDIAGVNDTGQVWYTTDLISWTNIPGTVAAIVTGDLDDDGNDDIAGINPNGVNAKVFYTTDLSTWTPIPGLITSIVTGDLDGDGDDDIAGINPAGMISKIFYTTDLSTWSPIPGLITSIVTGDLDGDGDDDIAGINPDGVAAKIFYTTDLSTWTTIPGALIQITTGSLNSDSRDDLAGINSSGMTWYTTDLATWTNIPLLPVSML